jgi:hypothetical protein
MTIKLHDTKAATQLYSVSKLNTILSHLENADVHQTAKDIPAMHLATG